MTYGSPPPNKLGFLIIVLTVLLLSRPLVVMAQQPPALRGLGEPAAPESLEHPEKLFPPSPAESNPVASPESTQPLPPSPLMLKSGVKSTVRKEPFTLSGAVRYAEQNYPAILRARTQTAAARENIKVQKLNEYMPDGLIQYQEVMASHNKLTQILYGSPVFPANPGPGFENVNMQPRFYSGVGFSVDWAPIDFGLHKARINLAKAQYNQANAQYGVTRLDMKIAAASAFLDVVEAEQQVLAAAENMKSFEEFSKVVEAQVKAELKPGADAALAAANLANAVGLGGVEISVIDKGIASLKEEANTQRAPPVFEEVPILQAAKASLLTAIAQRKVLSREFYPVFHWLGGVQNRGAGLNTKGRNTSHDVFGVFPTVPNYQIALIINWNFLDWWRLHAEKKVQNLRIAAQKQDYDLVLQNLKTEDVRSRAQVRAALAIAENMPVQVASAEMAAQQARARYAVGLASVAQVAEANQVLAQSRMQLAVANVAIWRAMLAVASVHGDLEPFLAEADRVQRSAQ